MGQYIIRRLLTAIPTLLLISFVIFAVLDLAPGDPTGALPETIKPEVRQAIREAMGLDKPMPVKYALWIRQFFVCEPLALLEENMDTNFTFDDSFCKLRLTSWGSRGTPVFDLISQRFPQTMWVVGSAYLLAILIAIPIGVISATRQYSMFDQIGTFFSIVGYSLPTFFTGILLIILFSVKLGWFPSIYDTNLEIRSWSTFVKQIKQMVLPVMVLGLFQAAAVARYTRSSMLDNLPLDYVRTVRAKGFREAYIVVRHVLRNSLIPVVTLIALGIPAIFGGAIITEQIFKVNGLGQLLILSMQVNDIPVVQTLIFIFAVLVVGFNFIADIIYGFLDPRIRFE
ncbi:MAG: ABC transporter permease [Caldilineaceae bacterium]|nr:ABC transporter permease [Caldilineaceae bacterium]MCB9148386.1 ABC transporter permease [Caldilineaceae bacterium]